jgi:hypothetical protein
MALGAVLVDRARPVRKRATGEKVEGTTPMAPVHGAWFRCRLTMPKGYENGGTQQSARRSRRSPELMYEMRDLAGDDIVLRFDEEVIVESAELGTSRWKVNGDPEPLRKKRSVIGWIATLERVDEKQFDPRDV